MQKIQQILIVLLMLIVMSCCDQTYSSKKQPVAKKGVLDLSEWNFSEDGTTNLNGEWEFYWNQLLEPGDFDTLKPADHFIYMPTLWNDYIIHGQKLKGLGFATFRLTVQISETDDLYAIKIPLMFTSYKLWINGKVIASNGLIGKTVETNKPEHLACTRIFPLNQSSRIEIILQIANFHHSDGGIAEHITLGKIEQIQNLYTKKIIRETLIILFLISFGFLHILLFLLRRRKTEIPNLLFGLICILIGYRTIAIGETLLTKIFPNIPWIISLKTEWLVTIFASILGIKFLETLFPKEKIELIGKLLILTGLSISFIMIISLSLIITNLLIIVLLFAMATGSYYIYILILATIRKRKNTVLLLLGLFVFLVTVIYDLFAFLRMYETKDMITSGILFVIVCYSVNLFIRFVNAYSKVESKEELLQKQHIILNEMIKVRTRDLGDINLNFEQEIHQHKIVQLKLQKSEDRLSQALEITGAQVWEIDLINNKMIVETGEPNTKTKIISIDDWFNLIYPKDQKRIKNKLSKYVSGESPNFEAEYRIISKREKGWIWIYVKGKIIKYDKSNQPTRIIGTSINITDRKLSEFNLQRSEERYRNIFSNAPIGIYRISPDGTIEMANKTLIKMLGFSSLDELYRENLEKHEKMELLSDMKQNGNGKIKVIFIFVKMHMLIIMKKIK